jgi:thiamine biosynthesis protein ThiS
MTVTATLGIRVNGELRHVSGGISISEMLSEIGFDSRKVAVERNREIVPRSALGEVCVEDGDAYEIVHFVGGG